MRISKVYALAASLLVSTLALEAQQSRSLPVLDFGQDARALALGGSPYSTSHSAYIYSNPVAFALGEQTFNISAGFDHQAIKSGGKQDVYSLSGAYKFAPRQSIFFGSRVFSGLAQEIALSEGEVLGSKHREYTLDAGYAYSFGKFALFGSASFVHSVLGVSDKGSKASTVTFTLGAAYKDSFRLGSGVADYSVGIRAQHMGSTFRYEGGVVDAQPPLFVGAGGEVGTAIAQDLRLALTLGFDQYLMPYRARSFAVSSGVELEAWRVLSLRAGYHNDSNGLKSHSLGAGLALKGFDLGVALHKYNQQGAKPTLSLSLGYTL